MPNVELTGLTDDQLREVIENAQKLLKDRDADRRNTAIEEAKAKLASVGLTFRDVARGPKPKPAADGTQRKRGRPPKARP